MSKAKWLALAPIGVLVIVAVVWIELLAAQRTSPSETSLQGAVKSSDGKTMEGVAVSMRADGKPYIRTTVYTDRDGTYYFPPLVPTLVADQYHVLAQAVGFEVGRAAVKLSAGKAVEQDFTLRPLKDFSLQLSGIEWSASLPEGTPQDRRAKRILHMNCNQCHAMGFVLQNRFDARGWRIIVNHMQTASFNGGILGEGDPDPFMRGYAEEIVEYLTRVAGPNSALTYKPLPRVTGDATQIVVTEYDVSPGHLPNYRVNQNGDDWSLGTPSHYEGRAVHDGAVDLEGNFWFTDNVHPYRSIGKVEPRTGRVTDYRHRSRRDGGTVNVHDINVDQEGNIWFNNGRDGTLDKFDPKTETFHHFPQPASGPGAGVGGLVGVDSKGNIWGRFGGRTIRKFDEKMGIYHSVADPKQPGGAAKLNPKTGEYTYYYAVSPAGTNYSIGIDAEDNAWFTQSGFDRLGFVDSRTGKVSEVSMSAPDNDDVLHTALDTEIISRFEPVRAGATGPPWQKGPRRQTQSHWTALRFTRDKTQFKHQWFTLSKSGAIAKVDIRTKQVTEYPLPHAYSFPYQLTVDKNYMVWVTGMNTDRVFKFNPSTERWTEYPLPTLGTDSRHIDVDNSTELPTVWVSYWGGPNKVARIQFRTEAAYRVIGGR